MTAVVEEAACAPPPPGGDAIAYRLAQQRILAEFGMEALRSRDIASMLDRATQLCGQGMASRFCKFLDKPDAQGRMLVRAGVGWKPGVVGVASLGADLESPAGYAFRTGEAVISNHLEGEERFRTPEIMVDHGIRRAINVLVEADGERYGVLEVDSPNDGKFDEDDLSFMRGFANLIGVALERHHAEARLAAAIEYQEMLTREASHRLKNSLAMVASMLELQMREDDEPRVQRMLRDAQARVTAISQTHDLLWRGAQVGLVDLSELACGLAKSIGETAPTHQVTCDATALTISADTAIPIGLILTELLTNAIKYAYGEAGGTIAVAIEAGNEELTLTVTDRGAGLPAADPGVKRRESLGTRMINSLTRQLRGTIRFEDAQPGTRAVLTVPDPRIV